MSHRVETLREQFAAACAAIGVPENLPEFDADARLEPDDLPARVMRELTRFEPCGQGNPSPRIAIDDARVLETRAVRGGHARLVLQVAGRKMSCFGGEMAESIAHFVSGSRVRVIGALRADTWTGGGAVELRMTHAELAG